MTANSNRKGEIVDGGYKIIDLSQDGLWAILKPNNEQWSEEQRQQWASEQRQRLLMSQREEKRKLAQLLPIPQRDTQYRRIVASLGLNQKHRISDLSEKRGLNAEEIDFAVSQGWLCSWQRGEVVEGVSPKLPGINPSGIKRTLLGVSGIGITAIDNAGNITGFQIASDNREKFGKYLWLSSASKNGSGPHLPSGELPIFVWRYPEAKEITETWLIEGGLKSLITALKLWFRYGRKDIQIIGAAGANFNGSIGAVCEALQGKVNLFPDSGSLSNTQILKQYKSTIEALTSKAYSVSVAWWGQIQKGIDQDIDELENTLDFDLITPGEFFNLVGEENDGTHRYGGGNYQSTLQKSSNGGIPGINAGRTGISSNGVCGEICTTDEQGSIIKNNKWWRKWLRSRRYTPHMRVKMPKFRFPLETPKNDAVITVNSGLGSAKTEALIELIRISSYRAFLIGYRNNLLLQTGNRASDTGLNIYHIREDDGVALLPDENTNLALCLDSIHHIDGYFSGVDIYLDETVSILLHACGGGTLKDNQAKALAIFTKALKECNRVILLDGNLADIHCDFIAKISGKRLFKIGNDSKIPPHKFIFIDAIDIEGEIKKRDKSPIIKAMLADGIIPWVASDSKTLTDSLNEIFKKQGKMNGFVLNKDTAGETWAKEFLANPDKFITDKKPDYFIISPTAESGVSITIRGYFTDKFTFFSGVSGTNSQHQMLFRLRDDSIPHYVFCPEKSHIRDRNTPRNYSEKAYATFMNEKIIQSAMLASEGNTSQMMKIISQAISRNNDDWWAFSSLLGALDNIEMDNLRKCLIHALVEAGHEVEIARWESDEGIKAIEKVAKESVRMNHAVELFNANKFDSLEEANQIAKSNPTKSVQRRIEKTRLLDRLPGIEDTSIWDAEFINDYYLKDKEFISKQQRFYFLSNFEISKKRSEVNWYYLATNQHFYMGQAKADSHLKIWGLQQVNIRQFLEGEYHKNSPELEELMQQCRDRKDIASALNIEPKPATESRKENIELLRSLLDLIGLKLAKPSRKLVNGVRERVYCVDKAAMSYPVRTEILKAIARKFDGYLESDAVKKVCWEEVPVIETVEAQAAVNVAAVDPVDESPTLTTVLSHELLDDINPELAPITTDNFDSKTDIIPELTSTQQARPAAVLCLDPSGERGATIAPAPTACELAVQQLQQVSTWAEVTQEMIDLGWWSLRQEERYRLTALYQQSQQCTIVQGKQPTSGSRCWVWHYSQWLEGIVHHWEHRPHEKFFKAIVNFVDGGSRMVWNRGEIQLFDEASACNSMTIRRMALR
ncbi:hypothetical protein FDUTEX481_09771 [Tolypothrix sp. PCC 7601]|nr:hypothetical protein FDUTEX481_09771 [Tolypothrix sp. PCC 7601]